MPCYQTATNEATHAVVEANLHKSIHIRETVKGPRYCPSIESKVIRFKDKTSHTVWLEPEGYDSGALGCTSSPYVPRLTSLEFDRFDLSQWYISHITG